MKPRTNKQLLRLAGLVSGIALVLALVAATAHATPPPPTSSEPSYRKAPHPPGGYDQAAPTGPAAPTAPGSPAYGIDLLGTDWPLYRWPDVDVPGDWTAIGATGISDSYAGDFAGSDLSALYVLDDIPQQLYSVDTGTGTATVIGACAPNPGQTWTGMSWDATTDTMFASATDGATATLFTVNLATGGTSAIGTITGAPFNIDIAVDGNGEMYGLDIATDNLIAIDKTTGAASVVGPIGFDANFAQGMDFDPASGVLYLAAYNSSVGEGELRIANTSTGATTLVGPFPGGTEVDAFAIGARPVGGHTKPLNSSLLSHAWILAVVVAAGGFVAVLTLKRRAV